MVRYSKNQNTELLSGRAYQSGNRCRIVHFKPDSFFYGDIFIYPCNNIECPLLSINLIPLTKYKYAIVDIEDCRILNFQNWRVSYDKHNYYARSGSGINTVWMHRVICQTPKGMMTDHKNGYGLDNRRCNLRICTHAENIHNQKTNKKNHFGFKGIRPMCGSWQARIRYKYKSIHLGTYKTPMEAALAYDSKAKELFGEFARTNF